ncbi:hypothetical protein D3C73_1487840 [compost metagenome]
MFLYQLAASLMLTTGFIRFSLLRLIFCHIKHIRAFKGDLLYMYLDVLWGFLFTQVTTPKP